MSSNETSIVAEDLVKVYTLGGTPLHALDHVSLSIDAGELVAITGSSGSGKSTLLNGASFAGRREVSRTGSRQPIAH